MGLLELKIQDSRFKIRERGPARLEMAMDPAPSEPVINSL